MIFIDIDETLFFTQAKIYVLKNNKIIKRLSNSEFNSYVLKEGENFDFTEFRDSELFARTSIPNVAMIRILRDLFDKGNEIVLLTARGDLKHKELFIEFIKSRGIPVGHYKEKMIHVVRSGNEEFIKYGNTEQRKRKIIEKILSKRPDVKSIQMFDDSYLNLMEFKKINLPSRAFLVNKSNIIEI